MSEAEQHSAMQLKSRTSTLTSTAGCAASSDTSLRLNFPSSGAFDMAAADSPLTYSQASFPSRSQSRWARGRGWSECGHCTLSES